MKSKLDWALHHAKAGFFVFPVRVNAKTPLIPNWQNEATRDEKKIKEMWQCKPNANIGIFCGKYGNGQALIVIDVDVKNGKDGRKSIEALEADGYLLTTTLTHKTTSGGEHIIFSSDHNVRQGTNVLGDGLDIRSRGGYIVAPGSVVDGSPYKILQDIAITPAPPWLVNKFKLPSGKKNSPVDLSKIDQDNAILAFTSYLISGAPLATEGDGGDATTYKVAAYGKDRGVSEDECLGLMAQYWNYRCEPSWNLDDLQAKVRNAYAYGENPAGCLAPETIFSKVVKKRGRFEPISWMDLNALPTRSYLIKKLLDSLSLSVVYGEPNSGKTFFCLDLALHIASGKHWQNRKTKQKSVVYVSAEGGGGISSRLKAYRKYHKLDALPSFHVVVAAPLLNDKSKDVEELISGLVKIPNLGCVVIDTLSRCMGGGNENSPDDMGAFINTCDKIREKLNTHVMIIHHSGKEAGKGPRGHSSLRGAVDTEIEIRKQQNVISAEIKKQRDGEVGNQYYFRLTPVHLGMDEDGEPITSCIVEYTDDAPRKKQTQKDIFLETLDEALHSKGEKRFIASTKAKTQSVEIDKLRDLLKHREFSKSEKDWDRIFRRILSEARNENIIAYNNEYIWRGSVSEHIAELT